MDGDAVAGGAAVAMGVAGADGRPVEAGGTGVDAGATAVGAAVGAAVVTTGVLAGVVVAGAAVPGDRVPAPDETAPLVLHAATTTAIAARPMKTLMARSMERRP